MRMWDITNMGRSGIVLALALALTGCAVLLGSEPTVEPLPTLAPSVVPTVTPAVARLELGTVTPTATITLTPAGTPTPPLADTSTPQPGDTPAPGAGTPILPDPTIVYFATPEELGPDDPLLLFWSTENASDAAIYRLNPDGSPGQTWSVKLEGSLTVTPKAAGTEETYVLTVTNGITTIEQLVTVTVTCPYTWFFAPIPEDSCAEGDPAQAAAVMQEFEHGRMFWFQDTGQIVVLFDDYPTNANQTNPAWLSTPDPYTDAEPPNDPAIVPPEGFLQPERGFGKVWREIPGVRDRLGWAINAEISYTTTYQTQASGDTSQLYFSNPSGEVITLVPDAAGWLVVGFVSGG
jgi:hypothetical protein